MAQESDPRVYFAAERTLLAWIRTGLTVMGLGFVVARFGLFLSVIRQAKTGEGGGTSSQLGSTIIGVALIVLGAAAMVMSAIQHDRFRRGLDSNQLPKAYETSWSIRFAVVLSIVGLALGVYLLIRSQGPV